MVAKELQDTLREITIMGYGLILICHSKEKASGFSDSDGNPITSVEPDLSKNIYSVASAICDLIAYIGVEFDENGKSKRWLYTRQTPTVFAGSRWRYLDGRIPFGYDELVNAIDKAIKKQEEIDGAVVVDHIENTPIQTEARSFTEVIDEAKEIWTTYLNGAEDEEEKDRRLNTMKDVIGKVFGNPEFKISQAIPSQKDMIEYFLEEIKDVLKETA